MRLPFAHDRIGVRCKRALRTRFQHVGTHLHMHGPYNIDTHVYILKFIHGETKRYESALYVILYDDCEKSLEIVHVQTNRDKYIKRYG